ncbi:MAG: hypothetical protein ACI4XC_03565 [Eubacterium sp.]
MEFNNDVISMFGLSSQQTVLLFSVQKLVAELDINLSLGKKDYATKKLWIEEWEKSIVDYVNNATNETITKLYDKDETHNRLINELKDCHNKTWYYILVLECLAFAPYTSLGGKQDKQYKKCKFHEKEATKLIAEFFVEQGEISIDKVLRIEKCYNKSINKISGKGQKIAISVVSVVAVTALAALAAALMAPHIAVALVGAEFEGLSGAALTGACLAALGGGAIASGGLGMAGGVAVIAGGGALLGLAGGSTAAGVMSAVTNSPDFTLSQSAKLETILKEIILNAQQDVVAAQQIIDQCQLTINELNKQLTEMQIKDSKNKKDIKNLKKSIEYIMKSCQDMQKFTSSYDLGLQIQG